MKNDRKECAWCRRTVEEDDPRIFLCAVCLDGHELTFDHEECSATSRPNKDYDSQ